MREQPHVFAYAGRPLTGFDENGVWWSVNVAEGWHKAPAVRSSGEARSGQDGDFPSLPLRGARVLRFQGKMREAPSLAALEQSIRQFTAVPVTGEVVGESPWGILSGQAEVIDEPAAEPLSATVAVWQLTVKFPDPLLYAPPVLLSTGLDGVAGTGLTYPLVYPLNYGVPAGSTPGAVTVPNDGTAPYWPVLRIDGPVTNPVVTVNETGDWVRFNGSLTAGQWLDVDCQNRRVLLNGQVSQAARVSFSGRWLVIPVGGAGMSYDADTADAASLLSIYACEGAYL